LPGGCVGCHRKGPGDIERGESHGFGVDPKACVSCHPQPLPPLDLSARIAELLKRARARGWLATDTPKLDASSFHASLSLSKKAPGPAEEDALTNLLLLASDRAAAVHNPNYARMLLMSVEKFLGDGAAAALPKGAVP
jgi:hypothetical protein